MDNQVGSVLVAEQAVGVVERPPEELTREERIQRLEQAIRWASAWRRRAAESGKAYAFIALCVRPTPLGSGVHGLSRESQTSRFTLK